MPLLPSGNPISFSDIRNEYQDTNPVSLSEYYRDITNTSLVPDEVDTTTYTWEVQSTLGAFGPDSDNHLAYYGAGQTGIVRVDGFIVQYVGFTSGIGVPGSVVNPEPGPNPPAGSGIESFWSGPSISPLPNAPESNAVAWYAAGYNTWGYTTTPGVQKVNQNVPVGNTISLSNFYNGRKT